MKLNYKVKPRIIMYKINEEKSCFLAQFFVVCRFYFIHFVFSVGEKALCNRTKEDCNVLELALAN